MRRIIYTMLLLASGLFAQQTTTLFQIINSSTMLTRPVIFRELQTRLGQQLDNQAYGLDADDLVEKMSKFFKDNLEKISVSVDSQDGNKIIIKTFDALNSISISANTPRQEELKKMIMNVFKSFITASLNHEEFSDEFKNATLLFIDGLITSSENAKVSGCPLDIQKKLTEKIAQAITNQFMSYLDMYLQEKNDALTKENVKNAITSFKNYFANILGQATYRLTNFTKEVSRQMVNCNLGAAVKDGTGKLSGGLHYLLKLSSNFQLGGYFNGELNAVTADTAKNKDTASPENKPASLLGMQIRYASDNFQCDALFSYMFGSDITAPYEFAVGLSMKFEKVIIGLNYLLSCDIKSNVINPQHLFGVSAQSAAPNSPTFILGLSKTYDQGVKPLIQISYPIAIVN
jgi:hypothetical protein